MNYLLEILQLMIKYQNPSLPMAKKDLEIFKTAFKMLIDDSRFGPKTKQDIKNIIDSSDNGYFVKDALISYLSTQQNLYL